MQRIPREGTYFGTLPRDLDAPLAAFENSRDYYVELIETRGLFANATIVVKTGGIYWRASFTMRSVVDARRDIVAFIRMIEQGELASVNIAHMRFVYIPEDHAITALEKTATSGLGYTMSHIKFRMCKDLLDVFRQLAGI